MYSLLSWAGVPSLSPDGLVWGIARLLVEAVGVAFGLYVVAGILLIASAGPARRRARRQENQKLGFAFPRSATVPVAARARSVGEISGLPAAGARARARAGD
jgi:hypothetical protein